MNTNIKTLKLLTIGEIKTITEEYKTQEEIKSIQKQTDKNITKILKELK